MLRRFRHRKGLNKDWEATCHVPITLAAKTSRKRTETVASKVASKVAVKVCKDSVMLLLLLLLVVAVVVAVAAKKTFLIGWIFSARQMAWPYS